MKNTINILIASKEEEDRKHILAALPEHMGFIIAGFVKDETGAIIKSENIKPDIIILDLNLPDMSGLELIRILRRRSPSTAIILLCNIKSDHNGVSGIHEQDMTYVMSSIDIHANLAIIAGVSGFFIKEIDMEIFAYAVKIIHLGGFYINKSITVKVFNMTSLLKRYPAYNDQKVFSSAERCILTLLAQGFSDAQIACELNLSIGSLRNCITDIRHKTKMKSRVEIVIYSLVCGLICPERLWIWKEKRDNVFPGSGKLFGTPEN